MQVDETLVLGKESLELERLDQPVPSDPLPQHYGYQRCPICGCVSNRVHSHYTRTLAVCVGAFGT